MTANPKVECGECGTTIDQKGVSAHFTNHHPTVTRRAYRRPDGIIHQMAAPKPKAPPKPKAVAKPKAKKRGPSTDEMVDAVMESIVLMADIKTVPAWSKLTIALTGLASAIDAVRQALGEER